MMNDLSRIRRRRHTLATTTTRKEAVALGVLFGVLRAHLASARAHG